MNLKKLTIAGAIVVLGLLAYLVWKNMHKPDTEALVSGNGRIEATEINVSSKLSGQLQEILVKGVLGILPPYIAKTSEAPVCRGL